MDMKLVKDSEIVNTFISDSKFAGIKTKSIGNISSAME